MYGNICNNKIISKMLISTKDFELFESRECFKFSSQLYWLYVKKLF